MVARLAAAAAAAALVAVHVAAVESAVRVFNSSNLGCQNIYPRSAANLVDDVAGCVANCRQDPLCHAAVMITGVQVKDQCQLPGPAPAGKACCIHKPHFDSLGAGPPDLTAIDMGTSTGPPGCPCKAPNGYDKPCPAPVAAVCLMYRGTGAGVFGPCSAAVPPSPPPPPPPPYELHRPIYHLTPAEGHNNDPNGLFYDAVHARYHVFVQWAALSPDDKRPAAWYHMSAPALSGPWERYPLQFGTAANPVAPDVAGCSGGATIAPDGTPTLVICGGATAVPANRSDPLLARWVMDGSDITERGHPPAYFPPDVPGKWDCSVYREPSGRYRVTFGSCTMMAGRVRPHQLNGYCDGKKQDGLPQVLSYVSDDFKTWRYLGEQWKAENGSMAGRTWGPRVECPYQINIGNRTLLKISAVGYGKDVLFSGAALGNGSRFEPDPGAENGVDMDFGDVYAAAVLHQQTAASSRHLYLSWIKCMYRFDPATAGFDSALTLPREIRLDSEDDAPTWEIAPDAVNPLRVGPPTVLTGVVLPADGRMSVALPVGAIGDALEIRVNFTATAAAGPVGVELRRTQDGSEQATVEFSPGAGLAVTTVSRDPLSQRTQTRTDGAERMASALAYSLRIFVDKSVVEAHLNARRSVTTRFYPLDLTPGTGAFGLRVINSGTTVATIASVEVWGMKGIY